MRVVIIGAGFGGLNAARALRRTNFDVTVIDRRNHHLFQPLLYQVATAAVSPGDIAYPIRSILRRQKNARVLLAEVRSIDVAAHNVALDDGGQLSYDYLIVATGAGHSYFGHAEWERWAPGLKSLDDALEIRRKILLAFERAERETDPDRRRRLLTFVVIGGGPTGVELAGAIGEISRHVLAEDFRSIDPREARVVLAEAGPRILPTFPIELAGCAVRSLERLGVEVWPGSKVDKIGAETVTMGDRQIQASTILWAAGVAASGLGRSLGAPLDHAGRVRVEADLTVPGHPEIFVIGDLASFTEPDGTQLPGVAPVATQQGRHAAANLQRTIEGRPRLPFHYRDRGNLATIGRAAAVADFGKVQFSGLFAWLLWLFVHIFFLIGFRNRVAVLLNWAWDYFAFRRAARLITGDPNRK
ncbi:MAG: NAD(P)/FAD-dependent oxidoreductase [Acidobacteriota bacterium]